MDFAPVFVCFLHLRVGSSHASGPAFTIPPRTVSLAFISVALVGLRVVLRRRVIPAVCTVALVGQFFLLRSRGRVRMTVPRLLAAVWTMMKQHEESPLALLAFHEPVVIPVGGAVIQSQRVAHDLRSSRLSGLGSVVQSAAYGDECVRALPGWSVTARHGTASEPRRRSGAISKFSNAQKRARRSSVVGAPRTLAPGGSRSDGDDVGAHGGPTSDQPMEPRVATPSRRRHQPGEASPSSGVRFWSLACCVAVGFLLPCQSATACAPSRQPSWVIPICGREQSRCVFETPSGTLSCGYHRRGESCARTLVRRRMQCSYRCRRGVRIARTPLRYSEASPTLACPSVISLSGCVWGSTRPNLPLPVNTTNLSCGPRYIRPSSPS